MKTAAAVVALALMSTLAGAAPAPEPPTPDAPPHLAVPTVDGWQVRVEADRAPVPLTGAAAAVAACESGWRLEDDTATLGTHDWQARNTTSIASGAFQFIDGTWHWVWETLIGQPAPTATAAGATPRQQLEAFVALWRDQTGAHHWNPSATCWQQLLDRTPEW
jgi:hypothetical protein